MEGMKIELPLSSEDNPVGEMEMGESFKEVATDLTKYVVDFAFGDFIRSKRLQSTVIMLIGVFFQ